MFFLQCFQIILLLLSRLVAATSGPVIDTFNERINIGLNDLVPGLFGVEILLSKLSVVSNKHFDIIYLSKFLSISIKSWVNRSRISLHRDKIFLVHINKLAELLQLVVALFLSIMIFRKIILEFVSQFIKLLCEHFIYLISSSRVLLELLSDTFADKLNLLLYFDFRKLFSEAAFGLFVNCQDVSLCKELRYVLKIRGHVLCEELRHFESQATATATRGAPPFVYLFLHSFPGLVFQSFKSLVILHLILLFKSSLYQIVQNCVKSLSRHDFLVIFQLSAH